MTDLKALRLALGLTQKQLAERLGSHPNTLAQLERGELPITTRLAKALEHVQKERPMPTLLTALQHFRAAETQETFKVTHENIHPLNDVFEQFGKGRPAQVGMAVDLRNRVLWSNSSQGYALGGTHRVCGLR